MVQNLYDNDCISICVQHRYNDKLYFKLPEWTESSEDERMRARNETGISNVVEIVGNGSDSIESEEKEMVEHKKP